MAKDGNSVSEYGDKNDGEDFAETMRVYLSSVGGSLDPALREKHPYRFAAMDALLQSKYGKLAKDGYWMQFRSYRGRVKIRIAILFTALGLGVIAESLDDDDEEQEEREAANEFLPPLLSTP